MKHRVVGRRLDRTTEHRIAMFRNMATDLFRHERITTTTPKAKELKRIAEKYITLAKHGTPHARRLAYRDIRDVEVLTKLFETIGPRFKARAGGYTRIIRIGQRRGDNAELSMIELVERTPTAAPEPEKKQAKEAKEVKEPKAEKAKEASAKAEKAPKAAKKPKTESKAKKAKSEK
jgi:large subunit ribosomal protein L17